MIDPRRQRFAPYLRRLADLLALKDWRAEIIGRPAADHAIATVDLIYGRKLMQLRLSEDFLAASPEDQRHTVAHELIHCHLEAAWEIAADSLPEEARPGFVRMMEYGIDGLADAIAPLLPLPDAELAP